MDTLSKRWTSITSRIDQLERIAALADRFDAIESRIARLESHAAAETGSSSRSSSHAHAQKESKRPRQTEPTPGASAVQQRLEAELIGERAELDGRVWPLMSDAACRRDMRTDMKGLC